MKRTLAGLLEEVATVRPDRVALSEPGRALTYAELWAESGRIAAELLQNGACEGAVVVLSSANGLGWLETLFGALRADCVVAVVDPKLPPEQWDEVCASLEPAAIFTIDRLSFPIGPSKPRSAAPCVPAFRAAGGRFLYFTSGSTGLPKGVLLAEDTLLANVDWNSELLALKSEDVGCLHLPLSHSYNLVFALCFLCCGATLLVERDLSDLHGVVGRMAAAWTTVLQSVPTSLRTLVERGDFERTPLERMRLVRVGAGVLADDLAAKAFRVFPRASIVATYGMTELGLVASRTWTTSPIVESIFDRFVPGLSLEVLDADEEGEIEVSHPLLFVGYFDAADRSLSLREGPYRTGDLGRWPRPGVLELRSRKKAVAKVAGVLVSLEEIARIAASQEGVADSCAIAIPHSVFGESVHVFVAVAEGRRPDAGEVARRIMERTLLRTSPRVHILHELPRSDSGKVARTVLEAMARRGGVPDGS
jgi:acyl-CoA synthetase (AMP-forming)/AMP-acid ligase II